MKVKIVTKIDEIWRENIWEEVKEVRDKYFVIYEPINYQNSNIAHLQLIFTGSITTEEVAVLMENELELWISRFPLPIMVASFDEKGDLISLKKSRPNDILLGYIDPKTKSIISSWDKESKETQSFDISDETLRQVYKGLLYETRIEKKQKSINRINERRKIKKFVDISMLTWLSVSLLIAYFGWKNYWVGAAAFVYSLYKTIRRGLYLKGYKTKKEIEKIDVERKKSHYYYHCELNPTGFEKLKAENYEKLERKHIKQEKESIKK